jgi:hypothetical protein
MLVRIGSLLVCLITLPGVARADTLVSFGATSDTSVTWEADGFIDRSVKSSSSAPDYPRPPIGTPYSLSLTFDPATAVRFGHLDHCQSVVVNGSFTIGGISYTAQPGRGYTHAALPSAQCTEAFDFTQFFLVGPFVADQAAPWDVNLGFNFVLASYVDLIMRDGFPDEPTTTGGIFILQNQFWEVSGGWQPAAVDLEQPAAVPEPATMTLFGLGLAAVARARKTASLSR